ncbi:MAG TPA: flippase-like domain-containing protein [Chloroflexi bacterium]|nr:flippase-like domain-containing protein [Chloroflexota bacterium]
MSRRPARHLAWLPGAAVSALALAALARLADWPRVWRAWQELSPAFAGLLWGLFLVSMLTRVAAWRVMLGGKVSFGRALLALNEGYLLNNVFPLRAGELGRAFLLGERSGLGAFFVASTIVIERVFDLALAAAVLLSTLPLALAADWAAPAALTTLVAASAALSLLYLAARHRSRWTPRLYRTLSRWPPLRDALWPRLESTLDGFALLTRPRAFLLAFGGMALTWGLAIVEYTLAARFFVPSLPWWSGAFILGAAAAGVALPSAPASLGVFEAAVVGAFSLLGVPLEPALACAVLLHLLHFATTMLIGSYALLKDGETLTGLWRKVAEG